MPSHARLFSSPLAGLRPSIGVLAIKDPPGGDGGDAHAIAHHQDDVLGPLRPVDHLQRLASASRPPCHQLSFTGVSSTGAALAGTAASAAANIIVRIIMEKAPAR
jgi:hypothetical protein